jgi:triacylglycerol lipase
MNGSSSKVLLIHGIWDTGRVFRRMASFLSARGWETDTIDLKPSGGEEPLERLAQQVHDWAEASLRDGELFHLVGFSMGGIVSRYYVQRMDGLRRVARFLTLSAPHQGTWTALPFAHPGIRQMRPGSEFLRDLNKDAHRLAEVGFVSLWTPFDLMIIPSFSSRVPGLPDRAFPVAIHPWMLVDELCMEIVHELLANREP